jgi:hypothetical protein
LLPRKLGQLLLDQASDQIVRERFVDREVQRPRRALIARKVVSEFGKDTAAMGEEGEVMLERREAGHHLPINPERRHPVGDALLRCGNHGPDRPAYGLERAPFGLVQGRKVGVDLPCTHDGSLPPGPERVESPTGLPRWPSRCDSSSSSQFHDLIVIEPASRRVKIRPRWNPTPRSDLFGACDETPSSRRRWSSYATLPGGRYRIALSDTLTFDVDVPNGSASHVDGTFLAINVFILKTGAAGHLGRWWILDVDGQRVVLQQNCWGCTTAAQLDRGESVLQSITFTPTH